MKPFKSFLAPYLDDYIAYRQSLGFTDKHVRYPLRLFDDFVGARAASWEDMQPSFFIGFRNGLSGEARTVNSVVTGVRGFFHYLVRTGLIETNPLVHIPALKESAYIPFIFSGEQTEALLRAVEKSARRQEQWFLKDLTVYLAVVLLARCGLRISEPLRLLLSHYRPDERTLYIENTKFKKNRLIPVPHSVATEIENYLSVRSALLSEDDNAFLLAWHNRSRLSKNQIYRAFHQAVVALGLQQPRRIIANTVFSPPRPHSLRHSFAVNTLKRIKERQGSPQQALPVLSAYLGHSKYRYTAVYLKLLDAEHRENLVDFAIESQEEL
jgi:integrase